MAKKKAPQRLAGAEESCISPEQEAIIQWFRTVKFRKNLLGGVDEAAMWKKLEELYALYEAAIRAERTRYNVLLAEQKGLPLDTTEVDSFAKGSPTRGAVTAEPVTERLCKGKASPEQCRFIKRNSKSPGSFNDTGAFFEKGTTPLVLSVQQF